MCATRASILWLPPNKPTCYGFRQRAVVELKGIQPQIVSLAEAVPQEKHTWRPAEGVPVFLRGLLSSSRVTKNRPPTRLRSSNSSTSHSSMRKPASATSTMPICSSR